ncbi:ergothioneine biosynthesis protein EgtB [Tenacibaculum sp. M341]|nr:ergothioneine biosynthesis protein EgtB [Tenacibaculum sp. M341]
MLQSLINRILNILESYLLTRNYTVTLCDPLEIEDYVVQPSEFASPPKWHLAHTTWFFEQFILDKYQENYVPFDKDFAYLFNSYYNNAGDRIIRTNRGNITRPGVDKVYEYRTYVDNHIKKMLAKNPSKELIDLVVLGINHEQQHQELLLTDIKYTLGNNPTFPMYKEDFNLLDIENDTKQEFEKVASGIYEIGHQGDDFCYDNELGRHKVYVEDYEISTALVTNAEYIEFIESGGYKDFNLWLDEGWYWILENNIEAPLYWHKVNGDWCYFTLSGLKKVNPKAIVGHISFFEAAAFAEWKKMRLPTEFEWEIASDSFSWGQRWEWTHSAYLPYPKFEKAKGAIGEYNGKFMMNKMVLRGASTATSKNHSRNTYRNFFHASERWQFTGIRLVKK